MGDTRVFISNFVCSSQYVSFVVIKFARNGMDFGSMYAM